MFKFEDENKVIEFNSEDEVKSYLNENTNTMLVSEFDNKSSCYIEILDTKSDTLKQISCKYGSYLQCGIKLLNSPYWNKAENVEKLIEGGDIVKLGDTLETTIFCMKDEYSMNLLLEEAKINNYTGNLDDIYTYVYSENAKMILDISRNESYVFDIHLNKWRAENIVLPN